MKKIIALLLVLAFAACNANLTPEELDSKLRMTMQDFLYKGVNYDSSKVKYRVQKQVHYEDKDFYDCEFTVLMLPAGGKDTMGTMRAKISKDFKTVERSF